MDRPDRAHWMLRQTMEERSWSRQDPAARRERRDQKLREMISWCATSVPIYRETLAPYSAGVQGIESLSQLPMTTKVDLRKRLLDFLPNGGGIDAVIEEYGAEVLSTSGTSGDRLTVLIWPEFTGPLDCTANAQLIEDGWRNRRIAMLTTPLCSGAVCHLGKQSYEERLNGLLLILNSSERVLTLTRAEAEDIFADLHRFRPKGLRVDPVYLVGLLRAAARYDLQFPPGIRNVHTSYEFTSVVHRSLIEARLQMPIFEVYGSTEGMLMAFECAQGHYHAWQSAVIVECVDDKGAPVRPGEVGEIAITQLRSPSPMPLIRYRTGDLGRPITEACACPEGSAEGFMFEGRSRDRLVAANGGSHTTREIDQLFVGLTFADHYCLTQHSLEDYELAVLPREDGDAAHVEVWKERAHRLLGERSRINVRSVKDFSPVPGSLKYRLTRSALIS